jgi:hypothetical protein
MMKLSFVLLVLCQVYICFASNPDNCRLTGVFWINEDPTYAIRLVQNSFDNFGYFEFTISGNSIPGTFNYSNNVVSFTDASGIGGGCLPAQVGVYALKWQGSPMCSNFSLTLIDDACTGRTGIINGPFIKSGPTLNPDNCRFSGSYLIAAQNAILGFVSDTSPATGGFFCTPGWCRG